MRSITVSLALLILSWPALGHHSIMAFYDQDRRVEIEGTVTDVFWRNPVSGVSTPPGFQREIGVKAQGSSRSMSEAGWPAAMASSVALR